MASSQPVLQSASQGIDYLDTRPRGNATAIICIHGWACSALDYQYLFAELSKPDFSLRAIAISLPGHGTSSPSTSPTGSVAEMANATLALLNELKISDVVLVGHSMGVRIITEIWRTSLSNPLLQVRGMVFLDGSHYKLRKGLFAFDPGDARSASLTRDDKINGMIAAFRRMFSAQTPPEFQESTLDNLRTMDLAYSEKVRKGFIEYDRNELDEALAALGQSGTPLLSFQSTDVDDENQRIPLKDGERSKWMRFLQEQIPQAHQVVVKDSMHFPHVDQPDVVAKRLKDWLRELGLW